MIDRRSVVMIRPALVNGTALLNAISAAHNVTLHLVNDTRPGGVQLGLVQGWNPSTERQHIRLMTDERPTLEAGVLTISGRMKAVAYEKRTVRIKAGWDIQVTKLAIPDGRQWETTGYIFRGFRTLYGLRMSLGAKCKRRKR